MSDAGDAHYFLSELVLTPPYRNMWTHWGLICLLLLAFASCCVYPVIVSDGYTARKTELDLFEEIEEELSQELDVLLPAGWRRF
ncbi:unnamed protein product [Taenia asiatica]|uniref:Dolichol-phosphate mannosyltransferase subunit 3 n=1 Tax=Taenia asiatica TaxID=60517 RepID=A0A0R3W7J2_TAEAS|nr:unnamed protein product [Taenia asiatica]